MSTPQAREQAAYEYGEQFAEKMTSLLSLHPLISWRAGEFYAILPQLGYCPALNVSEFHGERFVRQYCSSFNPETPTELMKMGQVNLALGLFWIDLSRLLSTIPQGLSVRLVMETAYGVWQRQQQAEAPQ